LSFPLHKIPPDGLLHFVETDEFGDDWRKLGFDVENDLWALQALIMSGPENAPVISGTGGLRKMRFARPDGSRGKSGGVRVCYAYFKKHWMVLLAIAYPKSKQDNLTAAEKAGIKQYLDTVEKWLDARSTRSKK
jgi:hypothetical protein